MNEEKISRREFLKFIINSLIFYFFSCYEGIKEQEIIFPKRKPNKVAIFSGHVAKPIKPFDTKGAISYSGIPEYIFNDDVVRLFKERENKLKNIEYFIVLAEENIGLKDRVKLVNELKPDLYLEIHHDSAQKRDIIKARKEGKKSKLWNLMKGFSVHYSEENIYPKKSEKFARLLAKSMLEAGFEPNLYHAIIEKIPYKDVKLGLYNRINKYGLYVLKNIKSPSVIMECGVIINPWEEKELLKKETRKKIIKAINKSLKKYFIETYKTKD